MNTYFVALIDATEAEVTARLPLVPVVVFASEAEAMTVGVAIFDRVVGGDRVAVHWYKERPVRIGPGVTFDVTTAKLHCRECKGLYEDHAPNGDCLFEPSEFSLRNPSARATMFVDVRETQYVATYDWKLEF